MLSAIARQDKVEKLDSYHFDILIIGGGITGAGIALDARTRGLSVALIDMQDFSAGTSSRSTKLVHGGLRYLKQFEVKMVAEVGKERAIVYENAPHVTTPIQMLLPFYKKGTFGRTSTSIGLKVYDFLAGVKKEERRIMLSKDETLRLEPLLKEKSLLGGGLYTEYRTDDARLTIEVMKKADELGALCVNYVKMDNFFYHNGKVQGVQAKDLLMNKEISIQATHVINAAGPWVDEVRSKDSIENGKQLRLTKGVHIVLDRQRFPLKQAIYFDAPDGRMIFAIPRGDKAYIGTTDTVYEKNPIHPIASNDDVSYLIDNLNRQFPDHSFTFADVESTWAGVRPLIFEEGKDPSEISRKDEVWRSTSGLWSIAGGKLTGYRKMAETIVDEVMKEFDSTKQIASGTKHLSLSGGGVNGSTGLSSFLQQKKKEGQLHGLSEEESMELASYYGSNVDHVFSFYAFLNINNTSLPRIEAAKLAYSIQYEMCMKPQDFLIRRSGYGFFHLEKAWDLLSGVTEFLGDRLHYSPEQKETLKKEAESELTLLTQFKEGKFL
ncbi:glycerol-3-phosphate dehydrogenase/oxidase [Paenisporosarcina cavernae]|uniref:Glycerol-3-phosphate dehydrogenase n=1 Tax=Paenisporosarcina cavernae TaxID=2320858 RepID=A0A385YTR6_9BACL|nr:glycerol-3-phosphate dehydrogenase/oxidase [Paenisporosarcina cavernae]AYC29317.1 glycerol-3-phosphate dehydrogenase/oxidase [Paenisporosarcina cavernae]